MEKIRKIIKIAVIVFLVLLVGGISAVYIAFLPSKIKVAAQNYVRENYKREVDFDKISFTLFGIKVNNFKISEESTFENGKFVEAEQIVLKFELLPLLKGDIKIKSLLLNGVKVNIVKEADGKFNFDSFILQDATDKTAKNQDGTEDSSFFGLIADIITLQNSSFVYLDKETNMRFGVNNLNLTVKDFSLTDLFSFTLNLDTTLKMGDITLNPLSINLDAQANLANLNLKDAYIDIKPLILSYQTAKLNYTGKIKDFTNPTVYLQGKMDGITDKIITSIKPMDLPKFALPAIDLILKANVDFDNSKATVSQADITLGKSYINNIASMDFSAQDLVYKAETKFDFLLTDIYESAKDMLEEIAPTGNIGGYLNTFSTKSGPEMKGKVMITDVGAIIDKKELKGLTGEITIASLKDIKTNIITGTYHDSNFKTSLSYTQPDKPINIDFMLDLEKFTLNDINLDEILKTTTNIVKTEEQPKANEAKIKEKNGNNKDFGIYNIKLDVKVKEVSNNVLTANDLSLKADLKNLSNDISKLQGTLNFKSANGEIRDINKIMNSSKILMAVFSVVKVVQQVFSIAKLDGISWGSTLAYSQIEGIYTIKDGVINLDKSIIATDLLTVKAGGNIDLVTEKLNMKVDTHFGKVTEGSGFKPVVLNIKGTMSEPKYSVNVVSTVTSLVNIPTNILKTGVKMSTNTASGVTDGIKGVASAIGKLF
ncbi:MAG: AsmA family protein [Elusimicrobiaceae bacterium]|nr:AsmA family protein [Elusimicrobiaceae bacterium]